MKTSQPMISNDNLFSTEKGSSLADSHKPLWSAFLGRYNDISVAIRIKCVQYTMHFLINHPELQENIVDTLKVIHFIGNRRMEFFD